MNCNEFVELVTSYLEGALDAETERRFIQHIPECAGCDRYLDQIRTTITALGELPAEHLDPDVRDELLFAFRNWRADRG